MGFFSNLKKNLEEEVNKNQELKEALNKYKGNKGGKAKSEPEAGASAEQAEAAKAEAKQKAEEAVKSAREAAAKGAEATKETLDAGRKAMGDLFGKASEFRSKVKEDMSGNEFVQNLSKAREELKSKVEDTDTAKAARKAAQQVGKTAKKFAGATENIMENKHELGEKKGYFKDIHAEPAPEVDEKDWDTETTTLVQTKSKEGPWDAYKARMRQLADKHPALRSIWGFAERVGEKTGAAAGNMGDRVFGETDEALTVYEIKERDPDFAMMGFMKEVRTVIIPEVLEAYLSADENTLKARCSGDAWRAMFATVQERKSQQYSFDTRVLAVRDVQLTGARVLDNGPTLVVQFNAQQIHCIRDKHGEVVDGGDDDIRSVFYTWAFQLDQESHDLNWQLVEFQTMGAMKMI